jgi:transcriptional regulator with AAA-type ATPase domain
VIDAATQAWEATGSAMKEFDAATVGADAVLIRHVEAMSPGLAMALASRLANTIKSSKCIVVGTLTSAVGAAATPEHERLAAVFGPMIRISALRERSEDIPAIAQVVLVDAQSRKLRLSSGALRCLVRAPWPGNILQLRALLESVAADATGEIQAAHLPSEIQACATRRQLTALEHVELKAILDALRQSNGNKVIAANIVGVSRSTLYRKLSSYRIDPDADYF